jgi:hypothetical protein
MRTARPERRKDNTHWLATVSEISVSGRRHKREHFLRILSDRIAARAGQGHMEENKSESFFLAKI